MNYLQGSETYIIVAIVAGGVFLITGLIAALKMHKKITKFLDK